MSRTFRCRCGFEGSIGDDDESYFMWRRGQKAFVDRAARRLGDYVAACVAGTEAAWLQQYAPNTYLHGELDSAAAVVEHVLGVEDEWSLDLQRCPRCARLYVELDGEPGARCYAPEEVLDYSVFNPPEEPRTPR